MYWIEHVVILLMEILVFGVGCKIEYLIKGFLIGGI